MTQCCSGLILTAVHESRDLTVKDKPSSALQLIDPAGLFAPAHVEQHDLTDRKTFPP